MYAELLQAVGTLVTIAGLVVVAPVEAGRVVPELWAWLTRQGQRARGWAARWLKFLRRDGQVNAGSMHGVVAILSSVWAVGRVGLSDQGTTEEQLEALRRAVDGIYSELTRVHEDHNALKAVLTQRLDQLTQDLAELRQRVEEHQREQTRLNGRGFPLAAVGALLAGMPGAWLVSETVWPDGSTSTGPSWLWWPLAAVGAGAVTVAVRWLRQAWQDVRAGWREARPPAPKADEAPAAPAVEAGGSASQPAVEVEEKRGEPEAQPS